MAGFSADFESAISVQQQAARKELQKSDALISTLFPTMKQRGGSSHEIYIGPVEYQRTSTRDVFGLTPNAQHPSIRTRKNNLIKSNLLVSVPREVAQTIGMSVDALAAKYVEIARLAYFREYEKQISEFLVDTYEDNPIMDGRRVTEDNSALSDSRAFPATNNFVPRNSRTGTNNAAVLGRWDFLDLYEARLRLADRMQVPVSSPTAAAKGVSQSVMDAKYIVFCSNKAFFSLLKWNRQEYFSGDYNTGMGAFKQDGFNVKVIQDMIFCTTSQPLVDTGRPTHYNTDGEGATSGTGLPDSWEPVLIFPKGALQLAKPFSDSFALATREFQERQFNEVIFGTGNTFGVRTYDELVLRYYVNVA